MRGKEILVTIYGTTKPLRQWAEEYDLTYEIVFERFLYGWKDENLILPERCDMLTKAIVHKLWGGRWVYRNELSRKNRKHEFRWNDTTKWVYVGRRPVYT
jgi:hypothetical protein